MSGFRFMRLSSKLLRRRGWHGTEEDPIITLGHWCPACRTIHDFPDGRPFGNGHRWSWDGNTSAPSFSPSMNISWGPFPDGRIERCHYFLTAGKLRFCGDCTHALSGRTVDLPDVPDEYFQRSSAVEVETDGEFRR